MLTNPLETVKLDSSIKETKSTQTSDQKVRKAKVKKMIKPVVIIEAKDEGAVVFYTNKLEKAGIKYEVNGLVIECDTPSLIEVKNAIFA